MATKRYETDPDAEYEVIQTLKEDLYLVRRKSDDEKLLGWPFEKAGDPNKAYLRRLLQGPDGNAIDALLNHENLVSIAGSLERWEFSPGVSTVPPQLLLLGDYCDAGTLATLLENPPLHPTKTGFLPESMCWHVLTSLLSALAWLHDGYRYDEAYVDELGDRREWINDPDWLPILHRGIRPQSIFFQQPRGLESFGLCKLGDFSNCFVSGHVNWRSGGPVVSTERGNPPLLDVKKWMAVKNIYELPKVRTELSTVFEPFLHINTMSLRRTAAPTPADATSSTLEPTSTA
jgi:serine/threonine protein kinase